MQSLPIPSTAGSSAEGMSTSHGTIGELIESLTHGALSRRASVHLDPDLNAANRRRPPGWKPSLGQVSAAQSHLRNCGVGAGDLFLFFGWFRPVELRGGIWAFRPGEPGFHSLFGWLRVGRVIPVQSDSLSKLPSWLADHPHVEHAARFENQGNTIYVASKVSNGRTDGITGAGVFDRWSSDLQLSASNANRSIWKVPVWMKPCNGRPPLTYHGDPKRWIGRDDGLLLRTAAKGQEFVLDADYYPEAEDWARELIRTHQ